MSCQRRFGCLHEVVEVADFFVGFARAESLDCFGADDDGVHEFVRWRHCGLGCLLALELHCVAEPFRSRVFDMADMRAVVLRRRVEIPPVYRVERPSASVVGFFVDLDFASHWC